MKTVHTVAMALLLAPCIVLADSVDVNLASHHSKPCYTLYAGIGNEKCIPYNNSNPGIGITLDIMSHVTFSGGVYYNSFNYLSTYVGIAIEDRFTYGDVMVGYGISNYLVTGYDRTTLTDNVIMYVPVPKIMIGTNKYWINVGVLPAIKGRLNATVLMLQASFKL